MRNKHRQLVVGALGVVVFATGGSLRILVMSLPREVLSRIGSLGSTSGAPFGSATTDVPYHLIANIAMALVYAGLVLMVAPVIAWLFLPPEKTRDENNGA